MKFNWFVGIDISKKTFDAALKKENEVNPHAQFSNDSKGIRLFLKWIKEQGLILEDGLICLEHTGVYCSVFLDILYAKKANVWLEHALTIKRSLGLQRGKSDKVDAIRIAEYAWRFNDNYSLWEPSRAELNKLKALTSLRFRLIKSKKMLKAPASEMADMGLKGLSKVQQVTRTVVTEIEAQLLEVESQIEKLIKKDKKLNRLQEIITSVDGVGKVTAWQMIISTNEFKNFNSSRQFACYSGVVPFEYSSGSSIYSRPKVSYFANKRMKELLHMSALSATIMKGELNDYYQRKVAEGKSKMLVLNNIRNKLVQRIFSCVKQDRKYDKNYTPKLV